jgi:hypothetical protein
MGALPKHPVGTVCCAAMVTTASAAVRMMQEAAAVGAADTPRPTDAELASAWPYIWRPR